MTDRALLPEPINTLLDKLIELDETREEARRCGDNRYDMLADPDRVSVSPPLREDRSDPRTPVCAAWRGPGANVPGRRSRQRVPGRRHFRQFQKGNPLQHFGIKNEPLDDKIYVGLLNADRSQFLAGTDLIDPDTGDLADGMANHLATMDHEDCSDLAIAVVAHHLIANYGGRLAIAYPDGSAFKIHVERTTAEDLAAEQAAIEALDSAQGQ